ncbi:hypothetical protein AB4851_08325 [Burkholderia sp. 22PA0099]|uniref:hypothetical protein n=1 Tax=Burkholderia sp. 22PA0099 TaxID=3237372 RepID=UPI0039C38332
MSDDRKRVPQNAEYFQAVGLATIAFARLEWDAVWCCERLDPGYINRIEPDRKTAGRIAGDLENYFARIVDDALKEKSVPLALEFGAVTRERNGLMHGKPGTAENGDQRLFRNGDEWTIEKVNEFADRCVRAGEPLNALLYAELKEPCTTALHPLA